MSNLQNKMLMYGVFTQILLIMQQLKLQGSRLNNEEHLSKYAIVTDNTYPYCFATKQVAVEQVVKDIDKQVKIKRYGMEVFPDILQEIADNFNKHKQAYYNKSLCRNDRGFCCYSI